MILYDAKVLVCSCPRCGCTCYAVVANEREHPSWFQHVGLPVCRNIEANVDVFEMICSLVKKDAHEKIIEQWVKRLLKVKA